MSELFSEAIIISILAAMVRIATPLLIAALGELIAERAGVINLGLEGTMLMGCFLGFAVSLNTGSPWAGVGAAVLAGLFMGLVMAFMTVTLKLEQFVSGLSLNLLASGLTLYWFRSSVSSDFDNQPTIELLSKINIPLLSDIPYVGEILFSHNALTYFAFVMVPVIWWFLYRSRYGLELRCLGENPKALDVKGLSVSTRRYAAVLFGSGMAGLAGAFLSCGSSVRFVADMTAGRGWLALVIVIAGIWQPKWILVAALVFAFLDAFQLHVQAVGVDFPYQLLLAMPYVFAIVAMMMRRKSNSRAPAALGIPYHRS